MNNFRIMRFVEGNGSRKPNFSYVKLSYAY